MITKERATRGIINFLTSYTAKNTYIVLFGNSLSLIFALIYTVIAYRLLSYSDFGYLSALWYFLLLVSDVADLGIGTSLSRFLPALADNQNKLLSFVKTAFLFQSIFAGLLSLLFFSFSNKISSILFHRVDLAYLVQIICIGIFAAILSNFFLYVLSAQQKFLLSSILSVANGFFRVSFLSLLYLFSFLSLSSVMWAQAASYIGLMIVGLFFVGFSFIKYKFHIDQLKKLLSFSWFLAVSRGFTAVASRLDVLMLVMLTNATEAGIYSGAVRFTAAYPLFAGSLSIVIAPKIASFSDINQLRSFVYKVVIATLGLIGTIFIFIVIAKPFLLLVLGEKSLPSIPVLQILLISMVFFVASLPAVTIAVYYLKKPNILTWNSILQVIIVVLGNYLFIPQFGRFGPAYSLIIAYGVTLVTTSIMTYYYFQKKHA